MFNFFTNSLELLSLYCKTNYFFLIFSCCFMATSALHPFLCFFHSEFVNCIFDNFPYPMPKMLITFPNFFSIGQCFMKHFPIASASEQAVFCSLYYALLISKGSPATIFQNCSSILLYLIPWAKIVTSS